MTVAGVSKDMTYTEFMQDRLGAVKTVKPSQRGWRMMLTRVAIGPFYSVVYITL